MIKVRVITDDGSKSDVLPDSMTLRDVYRQFSVNYNGCFNTVDSVVVSIADLDKTLAELKHGDMIMISSVVKQDGGAGVIIAGSTMILKSDVKLDDWKKVLKFNPDLALYDDNTDDVLFKVCIGSGAGTVSKYGIEFASEPMDGGFARVTVPDIGEVEDKKAYVVDTYGQAIRYLNDMEKEVPELLNEADKAYKEITDKISIL